MLCFRCGSHNPDGSEFCSQCGQKFLDRKKAPKDPTDPETKAISAEDAQTLEKGEQIAERYEVRAVVGSGPVGTVYRAHDLEIDVDVAVKVLSPKLLQSRDERRRFLAEIRNARKIKHPNVVRLYDEDQDDDMVYFTMQMLEGLSLRKIIQLRKEKKQTFQPKELEPIFSHICQALDLAHETTAHGDLKPENIIVLPDVLKVTDFGLLQALPHRPFVAAQRAGFAGAAYLAPEVREDTPKLEPPADIYSLGVILCEMVSQEVYEGPASALPSLPDEFEKLAPVIKRALNENPDKRHRSPREFFEEVHGVTSGKPARPPRPAPKRAKAAAKKETEPAKKTKPPRAAPSRKKVTFGVGDAVDPPTVVDASIQPDDAPIRQGKLAKKTDEDEAIGDLAGEVDADAIQEISEDEIEDIDAAEAEEVLEEEAFSPEDEADEDALEVDDDLLGEEIDESIDTTPEDDQETLVATPLTPVGDADVRVARPKDSSPPPTDTDDLGAQLGDQPEQVQVLKARKRQNTQPVQQPINPNEPAVEVAPQTPVPQPVVPVGQPSVPPPNYSYPPGTYSQPPYPYSQPPPAPSRVPVYIFLGVITAIVGIGVFFLVDYLIAAKQQLSGGPAVTSAGPAVDGGVAAAGVDQAAAAKLAAEQKKLEEERKRVEEYLKAEEARLAEERKKLQESAKEDEKRLAAMAPKPEESKSAFEARKAEERKKAAERKKAEEARLAEKKRKAAERRKAEEARLAEKRRKAEQRRLAMERRKEDSASKAARAKAEEAARKAEEKRLAEERAKAASNRPMLEEVPIPGDKPADTPKPALPPPRPGPLKPEPAPKEVAKVVEPPKEPAKDPGAGSCPRGMIFVSNGTARIGSSTNDPMRNFGELKLHNVEMKGYCIDRYEYPNVSGQKPRTGVSWKSAEKLCRKRRKRLCSEEEWEYACKGKSNRSFPYGNAWDAERCNTEDGAGNDREISAAGAFARCRSPFGVRDMSGNVSEWTASKYKDGAAARTYKGGSASRPNWATRCATRSSLSPGAKKADLGFRCCANSK